MRQNGGLRRTVVSLLLLCNLVSTTCADTTRARATRARHAPIPVAARAVGAPGSRAAALTSRGGGAATATGSPATKAGVGNSNLLKWFWRVHGTSLKFLFAGAVAGVVSRTSTSPLEVVATMQMCGKDVGNGEGAVITQLMNLWEAEGLAGFFKGNGANCVKVAPTRAIQFAVFERLKFLMLKHQVSKDGTPKSLSPFGRLFAGGLAGMVASLFVYPLEVIKTMLTLNPGVYRGILDAFYAALEGGVSALYRGLLPTLVAMFPYVGMEFMVYESLKVLYTRILQEQRVLLGTDTKEPVQPAVFALLIIGAGAGAAAQTCAHPLDVVRKRLQVQGTLGRPVLYNNMFDGLYLLAKNEGFKSLYRGLRPACAATIPATAVTYMVYEFMKTVLGLHSL